MYSWSFRLFVATLATILAALIAAHLGYPGDSIFGAMLVVFFGVLWLTSRTRWLARHVTITEPEYLVSSSPRVLRERPRPVYGPPPRKGLMRFER